MKIFTDWATNYGPASRAWIGPVPIIFISDPNDIQALLNNPQALHKGKLTRMVFQALIGEGLIISHRK